MTKKTPSPGLRRHLALGALLLAFAGGLVALSQIYWLSTNRPQTLVLEYRPSQRTSLKDLRARFKISQVVLRSEPFPIWDPIVLNRSSLAFPFATSSAVSSDFGVLNVESDVVTKDAGDGMQIGRLLAMPGGHELLISNGPSPKRTPTTKIYDIRHQRVANTFSGIAYALLPDGASYVGMLGSHLFIQNIQNGQRQRLISVYELMEHSTLADISRFTPLINYKLLQSMEPGPTGHNLYVVMHAPSAGASLYKVQLNRPATVRRLAHGVFFSVVPLRNGDVLVAGKMANQTGVFLYETFRGRWRYLIKGNIFNLSGTSNGRFAYIMGSSLHVANVSNARVSSNQVLYRHLPPVSSLQWGADGRDLFCVTSNQQKSTLLKFTFE